MEKYLWRVEFEQTCIDAIGDVLIRAYHIVQDEKNDKVLIADGVTIEFSDRIVTIGLV